MNWLVLRILFLAFFSQSGHGGGAGCCSLLTPRIKYGDLTGRIGQGTPNSDEWIQVLVLWRRADAWPDQYDGAVGHEINVAQLKSSEDAAALQRSAMGGVYAHGYHDFSYNFEHTRLWVSNKEFRIPARDTLLVVMVDRVDGVGGVPTVVGSAYVFPQLTADYWPKMWQRGDTSFRIGGKDRKAKLISALQANPATAAFIK